MKMSHAEMHLTIILIINESALYFLDSLSVKCQKIGKKILLFFFFSHSPK